MKTYKEDVTFKYYDMINSFRADNAIKIHEVEENEIAFNKSFFEIEKDLIKNKSNSYFRDIELLEELEFELRHENLKIVSVNKNLKEKDNEIDRLINLNKQLVEECQRLDDEETRLNNIIDELEKYIHNELVLDFYNDDMPCELIINKMEKMIKALKEE